jgi:hypothetical protein
VAKNVPTGHIIVNEMKKNQQRRWRKKGTEKFLFPLKI